MVTYMFQRYSLNSSHPLLPSLCPHICSLHLPLSSCPANRFISTISISIYISTISISIHQYYIYIYIYRFHIYVLIYNIWDKVYLKKSLTEFIYLAAPPSMWEPSSPTRDCTCAPCSEASDLNHWTTRKFTKQYIFYRLGIKLFLMLT